jgi:hypothetical protein
MTEQLDVRCKRDNNARDKHPMCMCTMLVCMGEYLAKKNCAPFVVGFGIFENCIS